MTINIILIITLVLFNIGSNLFSLKFYNNAYYFEEFYKKPWLLKIPFIIWYWLETLVRFKLWKDLLFIITCVIICFSIFSLLKFLLNYHTAFIIACIILLAITSTFLTFIFISCINKLYTFLKKKKKNKNKW